MTLTRLLVWSCLGETRAETNSCCHRMTRASVRVTFLRVAAPSIPCAGVSADAVHPSKRVVRATILDIDKGLTDFGGELPRLVSVTKLAVEGF